MSYLVKKVDKINNSLIEECYKQYQDNKLLKNDFSAKYIIEKLNHIKKYGIFYELYKNDIPVGYISAYKISDLFYGQKGYYTPEIGYYYSGDMTELNLLLEKLYIDMKLEKYTHHVITLLVPSNYSQFVNMGYGMRLIDGVKIVNSDYSTLNLKRINNNDIDIFYELYKEHQEYMSSSPIFLDAPSSKEACKIAVEVEMNELYFIKNNDEIIGYTTLNRIDPAGSDIFKDENTLSIKGTHILSKYQNKGFGRELIKAINNYAKENRFTKLCVDFESFNIKALNFWVKHFVITAQTYVRYIGE